MLMPQNYPFWYLNGSTTNPLTKIIKTQVLIVGGGMTGLSAAQNFLKEGFDTVLLEKSFCGGGASGKSSGFITPDSELSLSELINLYGQPKALKLWEFALSGVNFIKGNIDRYQIDCDYQVQDTLVVANSDESFDNAIIPEHKGRLSLNFDSNLYDKNEIRGLLNSAKYYGGIKYSGSFGIKAFAYCQSMKRILIEKGLQLYEDSPVVNIREKGVNTPQGQVSADYIIFCVDQFAPNLGLLKSEVYHAQTFLLFSSKLTLEQVKEIFPANNLMVWDTDLIYQYYRLTGENRLMLGGASILSTYTRDEEFNNAAIYKKLINYFKDKFPHISIDFEYMWPGLIGIAKDIMPIVGNNKINKNIYYAVAGSGLPWSAAMGKYVSDMIVNRRDDLDEFFSPYRKFFIGNGIQKIIGKKLAFALSNYARINQVY